MRCPKKICCEGLQRETLLCFYESDGMRFAVIAANLDESQTVKM